MISFTGIPARDSITIRFLIGDDRKVVTRPDRDLNPWGTDLNIGMTVGAFGGGSGGVPEVRLCSASEIDTSDDWCATFGYQWTNGSLSGSFKARRDASYAYADTLTSALMVDLAAETPNHGAIGADTATRNGFDFDDLQDGTYIVSTASNAAYSVDNDSTHMFEVFYDEAAGAAFVGDPIVFNVTDKDPPATGLHIRGFVGNDANDNKRFVGGESRAGVSLSLWRGTPKRRRYGAYVSTGMTAMTDANGYYSFDDLDGRRMYRVSAPSSGAYQGVRAIGDSLTHTADMHRAHGAGVPAAGIDLPRWDMQNQLPLNQNVTYGTGANAVTLYNFALVYGGGISGTVNVLGGSMAGAHVVAFLCTGPSAAAGCADTTAATVSHTMVGSAYSGPNGSYTLPGLREGYYTVMIDDPNGEFMPCRWWIRSRNPDDDFGEALRAPGGSRHGRHVHERDAARPGSQRVGGSAACLPDQPERARLTVTTTG